jgi:hypothetical protein
MKAYLQIIKSCGKCPNCRERWAGKFPQKYRQKYCRATRKNVGRIIPDWCPLEDYKED